MSKVIEYFPHFMIILAGGFGYAMGISSMRTKAVQHGFGHWEVDDEGDATFEWGPK